MHFDWKTGFNLLILLRSARNCTKNVLEFDCMIIDETLRHCYNFLMRTRLVKSGLRLLCLIESPHVMTQSDRTHQSSIYCNKNSSSWKMVAWYFGNWSSWSCCKLLIKMSRKNSRCTVTHIKMRRGWVQKCPSKVKVICDIFCQRSW